MEKDIIIEEEKVTGEVVTDEVAILDEENSLYVKFDKNYTFEGTTYTGLDLSAMEDMTGKQLINISKRYNKMGGSAILPENDIEYAIIVASEACKLPLEFFYRMPQRELVKLRLKVLGFYFQGA